MEPIVRRFFEAVNSRDIDKMGRYLQHDAQFYFPKTQPLLGRERVLRFFKVLFRQYPRLAFRIERIIACGGAAAVHWTNQGHDRRGVPYENEGVTIMEIEDGGIRYMSDFFKNTEKF